VGTTIYDTWPPVCLKRCHVSADCGPGWHCVNLLGDLAPPVCVSSTVPQCPQNDICDIFGPFGCIDAHTLGIPYAGPTICACGVEQVGCDGGCADDGGARCAP
jgi:hypothetical protein